MTTPSITAAASAVANNLETGPMEEFNRYPKGCRQKIENFASKDTRYGDLTRTHPAAAYLLAMGHVKPACRRKTLRMIREGKRLREVAVTLGLAGWTRKIPPEAVSIIDHGGCPDAELGEQLVNYIPENAESASAMLLAVCTANQIGGPQCALREARQKNANENVLFWRASTPIVIFEWMVKHAEGRAHQCLGRTASEQRSLVEAGCRSEQLLRMAQQFFNRVRAHVHLPDDGISETWVSDGHSDGFDFQALRTVDDMISASRRNLNCMEQLGLSVACNTSRFFEVSRKGGTVAFVELRPHSDNIRVPTVFQLRGVPSNRIAEPEIWRAAYSWLARQRQFCLSSGAISPQFVPINTAAWDEIFGPLESATGYTLPRSSATLHRFDHAMHARARSMEISSWLFPISGPRR